MSTSLYFSLGRLEIAKDDELKSFIEQKLGGWPIAQATDDDEEQLDLVDFHRKLDEQGYAADGLIQISTVLDVLRNVSKNTIFISPPSVSLIHDYMTRSSNDVQMRNYYNLINDAVRTYNPDHTVDDKQIWKLINFEKQLSSLVSHFDESLR